MSEIKYFLFLLFLGISFDRSETKFIQYTSPSNVGYKTPENLCDPLGGIWNNYLNRCVCRKNYYGLYCQLVKNCLHGSIFNGRCLCDYGWEGDFCEKIHCFYGTPTENFTQCECSRGVAGIYCDSCKERYQ
ncbi:hypothetical protein FO519_010140 [Halicephalobus sp. NKZ332]|nr:hypothetical protein FO519_010140 [Halicephalobus sp. NKZ332]